MIDGNGCSLISGDIVETSEEMQLMIERTNVTCFGAEDGKIGTTITKGTPPFRYEWSNGSDTENLDSLAADSYSVEVKDFLDCEVSALVSIASPDSMTAIVQTTAAVDGDNGTAFIEVHGGTPDYEYVWSHGGTSQEMIDLAAGLYEVSISDAHDCELIEMVQIEQITATPVVLNSEHWMVYPNPVRDFCWVEIEFSRTQSFQLNVYNALGNRLQSFDYQGEKIEGKLSMENYNSGIYFIELKTEQGRLVEKLVIR